MRRPPAANVDRDGYASVARVIDTSDIEALLQALEGANVDRLTRGGTAFGARSLLKLPAVRDVAASSSLRNLVEPVVGPRTKPVRATFFDKTPGANWPVLWHQDLSLAVADRHEIDSWGPWSRKADVTHVQPPSELLETMLAVRLHLDACDVDNGPLRVLPGTHKRGRLSRADIRELRRSMPEVVCEADRGDALLMRPLLFHASSPAAAPCHRRVIHIEFAPEDLLPEPLTWAH